MLLGRKKDRNFCPQEGVSIIWTLSDKGGWDQKWSDGKNNWTPYVYDPLEQ